MNIKEKIKSRVDVLDINDLRIVEIVIDSLSGNRKPYKRKPPESYPYYDEVIQLIGHSGLTTNDILEERNERI